MAGTDGSKIILSLYADKRMALIVRAFEATPSIGAILPGIALVIGVQEACGSFLMRCEQSISEQVSDSLGSTRRRRRAQ
jgi:hypothetical protein